MFRESLIEDLDKCGECGLRYYCVGGCRANAYHQQGTFLGPDIRRCNAVKKTVDLLNNPIKFFTEEELDISKYKTRLIIDDDEKKQFLSSEGEGRGPWIPFPTILLKKKKRDSNNVL